MIALAVLAIVVAVVLLRDPGRPRAVRIAAYALIAATVVIGLLIALVLWAENTPDATLSEAARETGTHV